MIPNRVEPVRKRHDSDTQVGVGEAISEEVEECLIFDYYSYWYTTEERTVSKTTENVVLRVLSLGIVGKTNKHYYRVIKHEKRWQENSCEPNTRFNETEDSFPVRISEYEVEHWKWTGEYTEKGIPIIDITYETKYREHKEDWDYWVEYGGDVTIFGMSTDDWKRNTVIGDVSITLVDKSPAPTTVQPLDTSGLKIGSSDRPNERPSAPVGKENVSYEPAETQAIGATSIRSENAVYPQNAEKPGIETDSVPIVKTDQQAHTPIPQANYAEMTGAKVKEMFPFSFDPGMDFRLVDTEIYRIEYIGFYNPRNNPEHTFNSDGITIKGTWGEAKYVITHMKKAD